MVFLFRRRHELAAAFAERRARLSCKPVQGARLVVILFPAHPLRIAGGLFVLLNLARVSREVLKDVEVVTAYPPGRRGLACYPYYPNNERIYTFAQIMRLFPSPDTLYLHVPECVAACTFTKSESLESDWLRSARQLHINICNQNILLMPLPERIEHLRAFPGLLTQTVAHKASATRHNADRWCMPLLHLGAYYGSAYTYRTHAEKQNVICCSPDANPYVHEVKAMLRRRFKKFTLCKLSGIPYTTYLEAISRSKYVISFGEGWDGYFWEPFFCGTVSFCVANHHFFPKSYTNFSERIYKSYDDMLENLSDFIENLESNPHEYDSYTLKCYTMLQTKITENETSFFKNICRLYNHEYDFIPLRMSVPTKTI